MRVASATHYIRELESTDCKLLVVECSEPSRELAWGFCTEREPSLVRDHTFGDHTFALVCDLLYRTRRSTPSASG